ncbi:hypothetical protein MNBD_DELTA04-834 [hydrothermal vent metagenome]|uniref:Uncharacterized protein n=1 Tax=hydrothermal vent metagenome TaxID=652676 RepID=A0A3B0V099_9ZZZZ
MWHGRALGQDWGNRWNERQNYKTYSGQRSTVRVNEWEAAAGPGRGERFCSPGQERELLELLNQLKNPGLGPKDKIGGASGVRRKYRIARKLRKYDDCRARDALRELISENACEDRGEGDIICVKWAAEESLQVIDSAKDLKKLVPASPLDEQEKIIRKYTKRPYKNNFAVHAIKKYLVQQAGVKPDFFVPLLVELFPAYPQTEMVARQYRKPAGKGLEKCLTASEPDRVWWGINLARYLGRSEFLAQVHDIAFRAKGNIDYSDKTGVAEIQIAAIGYYREFEDKALKYYRAVLYSDFVRGREYVISGIKDLANPVLLRMLKEYSTHLEADKTTSTLLKERLRRKIALMEAARR